MNLIVKGRRIQFTSWNTADAGWMEGRMDGWMYGRPLGIIRLLSSTVLLCRLNKKCRSTGGGDAGGL